MRKSLLFALACCVAAGLPTPAGSGVPQQQTFTTQTVARVIDVVVRDKKGKPVTGLRRDDFRLTEDGTPQEIVDFSAVTSASLSRLNARPTDTAAHVAPSARVLVQSPRLISAIVFERLTPESREPAKLAALKMLEGDRSSDESFGVFVLDLSLHTVQPFTSDRDPVRKAVAFASTMATSYYEANRIGVAAGKVSDPQPGEPSAHRPGPPADSNISGSVEDVFKELTRIQQGYATTTALKALATAMGVIPGRKTILYFSDGLPAQSDANKVRLDEAIATANRYNVAVYPVDAVGLRVHSQEIANGEALRRAALADIDAAGSPLGGGSAANVGEYINRSGTTSAVFNRLATGTGGFVVEDTNDLRRGVAAIDADRRFYYLLTYNPTNKELDGTWRTVTVTVPHQKVTVRARSGYIAAPDRK